MCCAATCDFMIPTARVPENQIQPNSVVFVVLVGQLQSTSVRRVSSRRGFCFRPIRAGHVCGRLQRESIKIKEEYYSFRDSSGVQFVLFSSVLLAGHTWTNQRLLKGEPSFVPPIKVGLQAFLCWLLYFYVALSLRENVLSANGSQVWSSPPTRFDSMLRRVAFRRRAD